MCVCVCVRVGLGVLFEIKYALMYIVYIEMIRNTIYPLTTKLDLQSHHLRNCPGTKQGASEI